ncbi:replication protein A 70 kDa DNA-binding subunit B-like isoform X2 [Euphorbia lathyris]
MTYTPLKDINKDSKQICIKVRVARSWDFINPHNPNQIFSFDQLFIDEMGDTLQGTVPKQFASQIWDLLQEGSIYHISGFTIIPAQSNYKISKHPFRIRLPPNVFVKKLEESDSHIPYDNFNFLDFNSIKMRSGFVDYLCDAVGQLVIIQDIEPTMVSNQIRDKRTLFLRDIGGNQIEVTFWGQTAVSFPEENVLTIAKDSPVIVAFVAMIVKPFNDTSTLNSTTATKFYINPEIPEVDHIVNSLNDKSPKLLKITKEAVILKDIESEKNNNCKSIQQLLELDIHVEKATKYTCKAKIKEIDCSDGWWYRACQRCKSGLQNYEEKVWCKKCGEVTQLPIHWYKLTIIAEDKTGISPFVLFGHLAAKLIGIPASNLTATFKDRYEMSSIMSKICGLDKVFQVVMSNRVEDASNISFKVTHIFNDESTPIKPEIPSPISVCSTQLLSQSPASQSSTSTAVKKLQILPSDNENSNSTAPLTFQDKPPQKVDDTAKSDELLTSLVSKKKQKMK